MSIRYFLSHPNFLPPNKKECHFFDKVRFVKPAGGGGGGGGGGGDGSNLDSKAFKNKAVKKYMSQMKTKEPCVDQCGWFLFVFLSSWFLVFFVWLAGVCKAPALSVQFRPSWQCQAGWTV